MKSQPFLSHTKRNVWVVIVGCMHKTSSDISDSCLLPLYPQILKKRNEDPTKQKTTREIIKNEYVNEYVMTKLYKSVYI